MELIAMIWGFMLLMVLSPLALVSASRVVDYDSLANGLPYPIVPMQFIGTVNGINHKLNGTAQDVYAQLEVLHPGSFSARNLTAAFSDVGVVDGLERRSKSNTVCCPHDPWSWKWAQRQFVRRGEDYLRGLPGGCGVEARSCSRISCGWEAAIWLCNDNYYWIGPNCGYLAGYAEDLVLHCSQNQLNICGQEFDTDSYNVIVRRDDC